MADWFVRYRSVTPRDRRPAWAMDLEVAHGGALDLVRSTLEVDRLDARTKRAWADYFAKALRYAIESGAWPIGEAPPTTVSFNLEDQAAILVNAAKLPDDTAAPEPGQDLQIW